MEQEEIAIIVSIFTLVILSIIMIALFIIFQKRKNTLLIKQKEAEKRFEHEIAKTQIEIREETFKNISWELHDNVGQLLTLAKIQLQNSDNKEDTKSTLDLALKELRTISKIINPDYLRKISITEAVNLEIERLNRLQYINAELIITGAEKTMDKKIEIILFRIIQEFISNTIKHAKAKNLTTTLDYGENFFSIFIEDNGKGFNLDSDENNGVGLLNIKNRANLINAEAKYESTPGEGTSLRVKYPYKS